MNDQIELCGVDRLSNVETQSLVATGNDASRGLPFWTGPFDASVSRSHTAIVYPIIATLQPCLVRWRTAKGWIDLRPNQEYLVRHASTLNRDTHWYHRSVRFVELNASAGFSDRKSDSG